MSSLRVKNKSDCRPLRRKSLPYEPLAWIPLFYLPVKLTTEDLVKSLRAFRVKEDHWLLVTENAETLLPAFVCSSTSMSDLYKLWVKNVYILKQEPVTFFLRDFSAAGKEKVNHPFSSSDLREELWLVLGTGFDLQISILERFGSDGTPENEKIVTDQKRVLTRVSKYCEFGIIRIFEGLVLVSLRSRVQETQISHFFPEIIDFLRKYDRLEESEKALKRRLLKMGDFML